MALKKETREILNREELIEKRNLWFERMRHVFDGTASGWNAEYVFGVNGIAAFSERDMVKEPEKWMEDCLENLAAQYEAAENTIYFRPLCVQFSAFGVHYIDKILGAEVFWKDGQWYSRYLTSPIGSLRRADPDRDELWQATRRAMEAFMEADVKLPLFGLPTIASALNIAVNLYGQNILVEMLTEPENAKSDLRVINDLLCDLHTRSRAIIPEMQLQPVISWNRTQPPGYGQLCGCTTQLISGELYRDMIADLDEAVLNVYENGGMIHLCGSHAQHIENFRNMKALKSLQLNDRAAEDLQLYFEGLRDDQIIYLVPCPGMTIEKALEITGGRRLVINAHVDGVRIP